MTAQDIIDTALSLSAENPQDFQDKDMCIKWLNMAMAESFRAENRIRQKKGKKPLEKPLTVSRLYEEVDMDRLLCSLCLPLGVAAYVYADKEEENFYSVYRQRFLDSLQRAASAQEMAIADCYGPEVM